MNDHTTLHMDDLPDQDGPLTPEQAAPFFPLIVADYNIPGATVLDQLEVMADCKIPITEQEAKVVRAILCEQLVVRLPIEDNKQTTFQVEFNGSGDSGDVYPDDVAPATVNWFLERMVEIHVHWDWYNNDGGGGDNTWDILADKLVLNGYYNVMESVTEADDVEI